MDAARLVDDQEVLASEECALWEGFAADRGDPIYCLG